MNNLHLPRDFKLFVNQVAGHSYIDSPNNSAQLGLLQCEDSKSSYVLKPFGKPRCGEREHWFYETVSKTQNHLLKEVENLIPKYYGVCRLNVNEKEYDFFKLEDLTHNMQKCNIMDCKIGKRTWDPLASTEKRTVEEEKYIKCKKTIGLCLPGFQMYDRETGELRRYSKDYGKQLDPEGFRRTLALFLNSEEAVCVLLVKETLRQLYAIKHWFDRQTFFHFYASSLLIAYDIEALGPEQKPPKSLTNGGPQTVSNSSTISQKDHILGSNNKLNGSNREIHSDDNGSKETAAVSSCEAALPIESLEGPSCTDQHNNQSEDCVKDISKRVRVRMIDFAHVFEAEDGALDENYLFGLNSLINILEDLLRQH